MGELPDVFAVQLMRVARARARLQAGQVVEAVDELMDVGRSARMGPAMLPWRSRAAAGLNALGRNAQALELVNDELLMARQTRSGWAQTVALQALAAVDHGRAPEALEGALELSEQHSFALERARSFVLLGAHERRRGHRRRSEQLLNHGLEAARECGAVLVAERARDELVAIGLSPRPRNPSAADALTPAERRVAELAVDGMTNREIAQSLFVSLRTIETHLTHCYQKLGIDSRAQLAEALAARTSAMASVVERPSGSRAT
jgi:DNA-binding CsgD family transcriptional regulator